LRHEVFIISDQIYYLYTIRKLRVGMPEVHGVKGALETPMLFIGNFAEDEGRVAIECLTQLLQCMSTNKGRSCKVRQGGTRPAEVIARADRPVGSPNSL
jgi:hypothetical protein